MKQDALHQPRIIVKRALSRRHLRGVSHTLLCSVSLLTLAACGGMGCEQVEPDTDVAIVNEQEEDERAAYEVCRKKVRSKLIAPATAQFAPPLTLDNIGTEDVTIVTWNDSLGQMIVSGTVDSQNGYGALVRSLFFCYLERGSPGGWVLVGEPSLN